MKNGEAVPSVRSAATSSMAAARPHVAGVGARPHIYPPSPRVRPQPTHWTVATIGGDALDGGVHSRRVPLRPASWHVASRAYAHTQRRVPYLLSTGSSDGTATRPHAAFEPRAQPRTPRPAGSRSASGARATRSASSFAPGASPAAIQRCVAEVEARDPTMASIKGEGSTVHVPWSPESEPAAREPYLQHVARVVSMKKTDDESLGIHSV